MSGSFFTFSEADVQAYFESDGGFPYLVTVSNDGILATNLSGNTVTTPLPYVNVSGGTITGTLNVETLSGTTVSGGSIFDSSNRVVTSVNSQNGPSVTLTTTNIAEGTNLYYTEARVDANTSVTQNSADIVTVSGLTVTNANDISQNVTDIANVSGTAFTAVQSASNIGGGDNVFSTKNGTDLEFRTVSGVGNVAVTIESYTLVFSGTGDGNGDVVGPAGATDNAVAVYDGTTGKLIKDSSVLIDPAGTLNANVISGTTVSGNTILDSGNRVVTSVNSQNGPSVTLTTTDIAEGTNLYYTEARVDANSSVTGNTSDIATVSGIAVQNQSDIANVSGTAFTAVQNGTNLGGGDNIFSSKNGTNLEFRTVSGVGNVSITLESDTVVISGTGDGNGDVVGPASATDDAIALFDGTTGKLIKNSTVFPSDITGNTADIATVSGIAIQNQTDIVTVSGLTVTNANDIAQNVTDIATVSGIAIQNQTDIANVSGTAFTAVQNGTNLGGGDNIFSAKNGTDLEFRTVSGVGNVTVTIESDTVVFSGTGDGAGDVVGPASATDDAIAVYDGTTGKLIKNSTATVADIQQNTTDIATVSGIAIQNQTDIVTVSGLTVTNANDISQNVTDIATVSGIAIQNQTDIVTVSGLTVTNANDIAQNVSDIANVSGIAFSAIQSGVNVGGGVDIFAQKNGDNLEFKTLVAGDNTFITSDANTITISGTAGGGSGEILSFDVNQSSHGFSVLDAIYHNGSNFVKAQSNADTTLALWIVTAVAGVNDFTASQAGRATVASHGLTVGEYYFVSPTVAGSLTATEPTGPTEFSNPLVFVEDANTIHILPYRPSDVFASGTGGGEDNTASNVGAGLGLFKQKTGVDLEFYTVSGIGNIDVSLNGDVVEVSDTGGGGTETYYLQAVLAGQASSSVGQMQTININTSNPGGVLEQTSTGDPGINNGGSNPWVMPWSGNVVAATLTFAKAASSTTFSSPGVARFDLYEAAYSTRSLIGQMNFSGLTSAGDFNNLGGDNFTKGATWAGSLPVTEGAPIGVQFTNVAGASNINAMGGMYIVLQIEKG